MFTQDDHVIFSASDLINYLGCRHATFLDLRHLGRPGPTADPDPTEELLKKKGIEHEQQHLACLEKQGKQIVRIDPYSTIEQRVAQTLSAMAQAVEVIYQGALSEVPWMGYSDFLMRADGPTRFGTYGYEVADTKLARSPQPKHLIQLCVYSRLVAAVQERLPARVHLVMGNAQQMSWPLTDFLYYSNLAQRRLERFAATPPAESVAEPCPHCAYCRWNE